MSESKPYKVYKAAGQGGMKISLPPWLAQAIGIAPGDSVTWELADNRLILRKARL